jgi:3-oxoadipate enol-lactonase
MTAPKSSLLFLHGVGGGHHAWEEQVPYFGGLGYPSHAWDQPGYGKSAIVEPYDLAQVSAALARLIESLGGEPVVLIGHSMGGFVAQETCARYPQLVKALALCFTSPAFAGGTSEFTKQFLAARIGPLDEGKTMAEIAARLIPTMGSRSKLAEQIMAGVPPDTYRKAVRLLTTFDRRRELANIKVPTLLVAGSEDKVAPPSVMEKMAGKIPGAEYVLMPDCGHLGPMDRPEAFNAILLGFLQRHGL